MSTSTAAGSRPSSGSGSSANASPPKLTICRSPAGSTATAERGERPARWIRQTTPSASRTPRIESATSSSPSRVDRTARPPRRATAIAALAAGPPTTILHGVSAVLLRLRWNGAYPKYEVGHRHAGDQNLGHRIAPYRQCAAPGHACLSRSLSAGTDVPTLEGSTVRVNCRLWRFGRPDSRSDGFGWQRK